MSDSEADKKKVFWACFIALVATSFVFGVRVTLISQLGSEFGMNESMKGQVLGVGLWPFAMSIIVFSLIIDRIGYKTAAIFAIVCHLVAIIWTVMAKDYKSLFWGTFIVSIANGTVEAFINPVVATIYNKEKAKWLNILHAGWPLGIALGALFTILLGGVGVGWRVQFSMCFIPVIIYAILIFPRKLPVNERVSAGVSYRDMLKEVGGIGFFVIGAMMVMGVIQILAASVDNASINPTRDWTIALVVGLVVAVGMGIYTRSLGNWMFVLILFTMPALATTELGTDSWMENLLHNELGKLAAWVVVMVSIMMTILRFYAGPIVHRFSPIGLLVISAAVAIAGLLFLSMATAYVLIAAAVVYAFGKTFLWSTTLGMVSEQFPKGGALTLNGVSAVGVLGMGIIGAPLMGAFLDRGIDHQLADQHPALYERVKSEPRLTMFGDQPGLNVESLAALQENEPEEMEKIETIVKAEKKLAFARQSVLPAFMFLIYLVLFFYFKSQGGYKPKELGAH